MNQYELETIYAVGEAEINSSEQVFHEMRDIKTWTKEVFVVFCLNSRHRIISREIVTIGTIDSSLVHPRDIFRTAVYRNASSVVISHNHPSGDPEPSMEDNEVTRAVKDAGRLIGISVLDHVIVGKDGYFSYADRGLM